MSSGVAIVAAVFNLALIVWAFHQHFKSQPELTEGGRSARQKAAAFLALISAVCWLWEISPLKSFASLYAAFVSSFFLACLFVYNAVPNLLSEVAKRKQ